MCTELFNLFCSLFLNLTILRKLILFLTITCTLMCCQKHDTRNIVIGINYTVVAIDDLPNNHQSLIARLFNQAPGITFKINENQSGTLSSGGQTYNFSWKYTDTKFKGIEIQFQNPDQYGSTDVADILRRMSGVYDLDRTNGVRVSENEGIDMDNKTIQIRMAAT